MARSRTFQRATSRLLPIASSACSTSRSRTVRAVRRHSAVCSVDHGWSKPFPMVSRTSLRLVTSWSTVWHASTRRDAGSSKEMMTPTAAPMSVLQARPSADAASVEATAVRTMRNGDRHLSRRRSGQPQDELRDAERDRDDDRNREAVQGECVADGQGEQDAEHHRTAALECRADGSRTDTCTTTIAVRDARTGSETPVTTTARSTTPRPPPARTWPRRRSRWRWDGSTKRRERCAATTSAHDRPDLRPNVAPRSDAIAFRDCGASARIRATRAVGTRGSRSTRSWGTDERSCQHTPEALGDR